MAPYIFPFDTCETITVNDHHSNTRPIQPWSFAVNLMSTLWLLGASLLLARTPIVRATLISYAAFEAWHTLSHFRHLGNRPKIQMFVVHILGYFMSIFTFIAISVLAGDFRIHAVWAAAILAAVVFDIYFYLFVGGVWTIFGGLGVMALVVLSNIHKVPKNLRPLLMTVIVGVAVLLGLFVNEAYNCENMRKRWGAKIPFHAAIEVLGFLLFLGLSLFFLFWELHVL